MFRWGKIIKSLLVGVLIIFTIFIGSNFLLIIKTDKIENKVVKGLFLECYFVNSTSEESKIENFKEFMLSKGWRFSEKYYETIIFRKGNLQKEVSIDKLIKI